MPMDEFGFASDYRVGASTEPPEIVSRAVA
jgi:hypothetical protein